MSRVNGTLPDLKDIRNLELMAAQPRVVDLPARVVDLPAAPPRDNNRLWVGVIVVAFFLMSCAIWHPSSSTAIRVCRTGRRKQIKCIPTYTGSCVTVMQITLSVILIIVAIVSITKK